MADQTDWDKGTITPPAGAAAEPDWEGGTISAPSSTLRRTAGDAGVSLLRGAMAVPEAAVGLADIATGGRAGKALEEGVNVGGVNLGFRPKEAREATDQWYSPEYRAAREKFQAADGVIDKAGVALSNPTLIGQAAVESLPLMGAGGVAARGALAAGALRSPVVAAAAGEGIAGAGSAAEQIRQETADGLLTPEQAALAGVSGLATAGLGAAGGAAARRLGIADVDTAIAAGTRDVATSGAEKGIARRAAEGFASEGLLEELPQSLAEQGIQNVALDRPLSEGMADAAVMGTLSGGVMGAGAGALTRQQAAQPQNEVEKPEVDPAPDPASRPYQFTIKPPGGHRGTGTVLGEPKLAQPPTPQAEGVEPTAGPLSAGLAQAITSGDVAQQREQQSLQAEDQAAQGEERVDYAADDREAEPHFETLAQALNAVSDIPGGGPLSVLPFKVGDGYVLAREGTDDYADAWRHRVERLTEMGVQAGDILNRNGEPFNAQQPNLLAATVRANPGYEAVPVEGGFAIRRAAAAQADQGPALAPGGAAPSVSGTAADAGNADAPGAPSSRRAADEQPALSASLAAAAPAVQNADLPAVQDDQGLGALQLPPATDTQEGASGAPDTTAGPAQAGARGTGEKPAPGKRETPSDTTAAPGVQAPAPVAPTVDSTGGPGQPSGNPGQFPVVEHTTGKGKTLRGVIRTDLDLRQAKEIDTGSFKKDGGFFIRERAFDKLADYDANRGAAANVPAAPAPAPAPAADDDTAARWTRSTTVERGQILARAGLSANLVNRPFTDIEKPGQQRIKRAIDYATQPEAAAAPAPAAPGEAYQWNAIPSTKDRRALLVQVGTPDGQARILSNLAWNKLPTGTRAKLQQAMAARPADQPPGVKTAPEPAAPTRRWQPSDEAQALPAVETDAEGRAERRAKLPADDRWPYGTAMRGEPPAMTKAMREVVDYMNGDITRTDLMQRLEDSTLLEGQIHAITQRLTEDGPRIVEVERMLARRAGAAPAPAPGSRVTNADGSYYTQPGSAKKSRTTPAPATAPSQNANSRSAPAAAPAPAPNTVFTEDAYQAARARMKRKLSQLNSGIDPELLQDGITVAGYHLERGARKFAAWAQAMLDDMGEEIRPYLKQLYMAVKFDPRASNIEGMDSAAVVEGADVAAITTEAAAPAPAPAPPAPAPAAGTPTPLYSQQKVAPESAAAIKAWAESQGFTGVVDDMHVTTGFSRTPLDASAVPLASAMTVNGGPRSVAPLGDEGAVVLHIGNPALHSTWQALRDAGASWDFDGYQPHITITYDRDGLNLSRVQPYRGPIQLLAEERSPLQLETPATTADTATTREATNDPAQPRTAPPVDTPLADRQAQPAETRAAGQPRPGPGRADDGSVRGGRGPAARPDDAQQDLGNRRGAAVVSDGAPAAVAADVRAVPAADYRIPAGGLTREGSWHATAARNVDLIELALAIEKEGRPATPAEQARLAKYVGFGAGAIRNELFPIPNSYARQQDPERLIWPNLVARPQWRALAERLDKLPRAWQKSVLQSTQYAHYTSEGIVRGMWAAAERMGFPGGKTFEPGMGIGNFAMAMPDSMRAPGTYTGIEFDGPTALIARLLSPEQHALHADFIKRKVPRNFFDLAIGNPPFSQTKVLADPEYERFGFMLHDYFFAKTIDRVRPGGLLMFVTSKGTMDKQSDKARRYLADRADLLGAIRLPSTAFEEGSGTSVVTDVIFLRKRAEGEAPAGQPWTDIHTEETPDGTVAINEYFVANPLMVLGQNRISGNVDDEGRRINSNGRGGAKYTVVGYDKTSAELDARFAEAVKQLPANVYSTMQASTETIKAAVQKVDFNPLVRREGVVYVDKAGDIMVVSEGVGKPLGDRMKLSEKDKAWMASYVGVRDLVNETRAAQATDGPWEKSLAKLNKAYDAFVKKHGPINAFRTQVRKGTDEEGNPTETSIRIFTNRRLLREDYDSSVVTQLETIDESGAVVKAPFLLGRTIGKPVAREVRTIGDALAVSLDETGGLNLADVARRMNITEDEAVDALGSQVYRMPSGEWQLADAYLSGDVVAKLEEAELAARTDRSLERNVTALREVQPEKLGPSQISVKLGASWVPPQYVNQFAQEIGAGTVRFDQRSESWQVEGGNQRSGRSAGQDYGTADRSPSELLEAALNSRTVTIKKSEQGADGKKKEVTDTEATTAAADTMRKIRERFKAWVWTDAERATTLVEAYNRRYNNLAPRRFDGSHLTLPGVTTRFTPHPHQLRAVWRQIQTGDTYLAHAVGAGKTFEMIAGGMEQKRLGLINKPTYVVPNHMLEQFANEFMEFYPLANIMVADDENFSAERRKAFTAAVTLNAPDAVVITQSAFERIGMSEESVAPIRDALLDELQEELDGADSSDRVRRSQLQQQIEAVEQRFDSIIGAGKKDNTIRFEEMGIDFIYADEAHAYRKLDFTTNQKLKGIDPNGSRRALDMYVKTRVLASQRPGRSQVFASGTPVTNTMGELYTIMRFFAPQMLDEGGIKTFDAWSRQFGESVTALEANAAGRYESVERFARFDNIPELMSRVRSFMDVLTSDQLGALVKRPNVIGGKPNLVTVDATPALKAYMKETLLPRLEASRRWKPSPQQPHNPDPVIAITSDGRFAALDPRFFGSTLGEGETTKLQVMAQRVAENYHATANNVYVDRNGAPEPIRGGTQVVFYNLGFGEQSQRNRGFNARAALNKALTDAGVARDHILWFDEANTDAKKERVFKAMRSGEARILIGSAKQMGTGVNVQKRLAKLHYFDPPWFPSDVEQPHGRILRQGNQNDQVGIDWYATKGTYDSTMWQMVARKQRFIDQAFSGDKSVRSMDDMSEASQYEQAAAMASGDPRALQLAGLRQDVERLERLQAAHSSEQVKIRGQMGREKWAEDHATKAAAGYEQQFKAMGSSLVQLQTATIGGRTVDKLGDMGAALKAAVNKNTQENLLVIRKEPVTLGTVNGFDVQVHQNQDTKGMPTGTWELTVRVADGDLDVLIGVSTMGADVDDVGLARRVINAMNAVERNMRAQQTRAKEAQTEIRRLEKKVGAPFEYEQDLAEKIGDLRRLEDELRSEGEADAARAVADFNARQAANLTITAEGEEVPPAARLASEPAPAAPAMKRGEVEDLVSSIAAGWRNSPAVYVATSIDDVRLPAAVREHFQAQRAAGAAGEPKGAFYGGKAYLFSNALASPRDAAETLFHEVLGHAGLRGTFGASLARILDDVARARPEVIAAKAAEYGFNQADVAQRRAAAEEMLAEIAEKTPQLPLVRRVVATIRQWLRENVPFFSDMRLSDADIVANFILPARAFVQQGRSGPASSSATGAPASFSLGAPTTPEFRRWFNGSKVVDENGKPLVVYHGTLGDFTEFKTGMGLAQSEGFFFAPKENDWYIHSYLESQKYQDDEPDSRGDYFVMPAYLSIQNPLRVKTGGAIGGWADPGFEAEQIERAKKAGNDGLIITDEEAGTTFYVALRPGQIKSATGNSGAYDAGNPNVMFSLTKADYQAKAIDAWQAVADMPGKLNWWHKTIGTQYNLAQRSPQFKRVFDSVQAFIGDVSRYATDAADLAPQILPKLETIRDLAKKPISAADNKAIAAPIFEGTLAWTRDPMTRQPVRMEEVEARAAKMSVDEKAHALLRANLVDPAVLRMWQGMPVDQYETIINGKYEREMLKPGIVWTPDELRGQWGLNEQQAGLYREFRNGVNRSLNDLAISDLVRYVGKDGEAIRSMVLDAGTASGAADLLREHLLALAEEQEEPAAASRMRAAADEVLNKAAKVKDLMDRGYAPLSRFGNYTLDVVDKAGERVYFGMFESRLEAQSMARKMGVEFPGATIRQGTVSEQQYQLFQGVTPETLELFGDEVGLGGSELFQQYLQLAKSTRSAMRRLIQRKGTAGFSEEVGRVLAGFVYSNARQTSGNLHRGEMQEAAASDDFKGLGELRDAAIKLVQYVSNPQEEAQALRGLLFAQYIGGSAASAMVNLTQTVAMTFPYLSQYGGVKKAAGQMGRAIKDALKPSTGDAALDRELKAAEARGTVSPQEVHQLQAQAAGRGQLRSGDGTRAGDALATVNNAASRFMLAWGKMFSAAEQFNRRATFIAAYRTAVEQGIADPAAFADKAIAETQGVYNKGNKPAWARGAVGSTLFTFKQYGISYVELVHRMATSGPEGRRAAAVMLGMLFLLSGAGGLPFEEDLEDIADGIMQRLGYSWNSKAQRQQFMVDTLGKPFAEFIDKGVSGIAGVPIDVSGRLGMGNLVPGTGLLPKKTDYGRDVAEIAGVAGDFLKRGAQAAGQVVSGEPIKAVTTMLPTAGRNVIQASDMLTTGMYRDQRGRKVIDTDGTDAIAKLVGFQPSGVAAVQEATFLQQNLIAQVRMRETEIADVWARGVFEKDPERVREAREMLERWNTSNPAARIVIKPAQIAKRVQTMGQDKSERIAKTAPAEIRAAVRRELQAGE